ncbi:hypothetical protein CAEBREN_22509 [Caenorhabditis brenneri]|uniref:Uncharacterized protein n=1 Tax=Caenorhabditis brenneri TaxID=135651 RepID=G0MDT1_CAEBE|nr:hypothetical protein CAEBREN_22509 [Caenorhabditis brenneri]
MQQFQKPLAYSCWEHVLQSLGANSRLVLYIRCPGIRTIDRKIPLKLQHIKTNSNQLTINSTTFTIGVIRHYLGGYQPPPWAQEDNDNGGVPFDVGRFQAKNNYSAKEKLLKDSAPSDEDATRCFENRQMLQEALSKLVLERIYSKRKLLERIIKDLREKIRNYDEQLAISQLKFEYYIMLSITTDGINSRELLCYNVPLADAMKYFAKKLIENREIICNSVDLDREQRMCQSNFSIENNVLGNVIKFYDQGIKSIEFPWCNAKFEHIQQPRYSTAPFFIKFYIPESALDTTIKSIHNMEQPVRRKKLGREDFPLRINTNLPSPNKATTSKWVFTFVLEHEASELFPTEPWDYSVLIRGWEQLPRGSQY